MKPFIAFCLYAACTYAAVAQTPVLQAPESAATGARTCPAQSGIFFADHGMWKEMEQVHSLGVHTTGVAKTAFTYGIMSGKVKATFPDAKAPVQLEGSTPTFCSVNVAEQGRDIVLVRLEPHGDKREIQLASLRAWTGINAQYKDKDMIKLEVEKQSDKTYVMRAPANLPSGEYIIFPKPQDTPQTSTIAKYSGPSAIGGYDFGFDEGK